MFPCNGRLIFYITSFVADAVSLILLILGLRGLFFDKKTRKKYWCFIVLSIVLYVGYKLCETIFGWYDMLGMGCTIPHFQ